MKFFIIFLLVAVASGRTPDYFPKCRKYDPSIATCIRNGIESLKPRLRNGISQVNLPALDPFEKSRVYFETKYDGYNVKATLRNVNVNKGSNFVIKYLYMSDDSEYIGLKIRFPEIDISAGYHARATRFLTWSTGDGYISGYLYGVDVHAWIHASPVWKYGTQYLQLGSVSTSVVIDRASLYAYPYDNSMIGRRIDEACNNPSQTLRELTGIINNGAATFLKEYLNNVFSRVPLSDLLTY